MLAPNRLHAAIRAEVGAYHRVQHAGTRSTRERNSARNAAQHPAPPRNSVTATGLVGTNHCAHVTVEASQPLEIRTCPCRPTSKAR